MAEGKPNILVIWGDDIGITNLSCYSDGLMGYRTPNIDRIADEGMRFTDSYGEQSCTAGRSSFITGQSVFRTGPEQGRHPGRRRRPAGRGPDDRRAAQAARLRDRAVRQEPPRRPERVPADGARLRRVLRQPLPPQRRGGAGAARTTRRPTTSRSFRDRFAPARRHPLLGDRRGRRDRGRRVRARRQAADRGHRPADQEADGDDRRRGARARGRTSSTASTRPTRRSSCGSTPPTCTSGRTPKPESVGPGGALAVALPRHDDRPRQGRRRAARQARRARASPTTRSSSTAPTTGRT